LIEEIERLQELKQISFKLDLAEALNVAFVGSTYSKSGENERQFRSWKQGYFSRINKLLKRATQTIWDRIGGKSRKM